MERAATRTEIEDRRAGAPVGAFEIRPAEETPKVVSWAGEVRETAALATPLILTSIAQMAINATTTMMVGHLGPESLSAAALATSIYNSFLVFSMGLVSAVAPMMAHQRGRDPRATDELRRTVRQ
ncbi:MAG: hypothetical protein JO172_00690, partial [Hyphomicrobiales bacterium]|nr:hypothetical protein [Hyphomicrobiales bacterium]